nr:acyl-CoA carboxylase subunit beta [uncultured Bacteroides sp.]
MMEKEDQYSHFIERNKNAELGGGVSKIEKQHEAGKMTARERIEMLLDKGTFVELDKLMVHRCTNFGMDKNVIPGDGVVSGYGKIDGRQVFVFAYDFTVYGGTLSATNSKKIVKVQELALKNGAPVIALNDSGGARIQEGVESLTGYASIFYQNTMASGVIPQISAILGPCAGGACYSPALTDFIFMVKEKSHMFVTGPDVVKTVTHEDVSKEELGGAYTHSSKSGVSHFLSNSEEELLMGIRELLSFLPSNNMEDAPVVAAKDDIHREEESLQSVVPADPNIPYDIKDIIEPVMDDHYFFEVMPHFAKNAVVGFARLGGKSVGVVANQPAYLAGVLDIDASDKISRFIRFCDCFNIPLVTFEDVPGFLPGCTQEHNGIIRHGAKIVYAYAEATVPKVTLITRKAYGGAYIVMSSKQIGSDVNLAYPNAEIAVMGAEGAVNILYRKADEETKKQAIEDYKTNFANPYKAAELGYIDEIILPKQTRYKLIQALDMARNKMQTNPPKKHGNMPL